MSIPAAARPPLVRAYRGLMRAIEVAVIVLMAALAVIVPMGVFFRFVLNAALSWTDEIGGFVLVWITFLAAVVALDRGAHLDMDLFAGRIRGPARTALRAVADIALGVLLIVVFVNGWSISVRTMDQTAVSLPIPRGLVQAIMPISAVLMLVTLAARWVLPEATHEVREREGPQVYMAGPLAADATE